VPAAGGSVVALESYVVSGEYVFASEDLRGYAEQVTSARFQSSLLIDHLHATLLLVGCFALYAYLTGSRAERWALAGLLLFCVEGFSVGIDTGATLSSVPAAQAYLAGQRDALDGALLLDDFTALPPLLAARGLAGPGWLDRGAGRGGHPGVPPEKSVRRAGRRSSRGGAFGSRPLPFLVEAALRPREAWRTIRRRTGSLCTHRW
jgi:hypothetical protein